MSENNFSADYLLEFCSRNNRICPKPDYWNRLYQILPNTKREGAGFVPSAPLILAAWYYSTDEQKKERLSAHIKWADENNSIEIIGEFIFSLDEEDWYHSGE